MYSSLTAQRRFLQTPNWPSETVGLINRSLQLQTENNKTVGLPYVVLSAVCRPRPRPIQFAVIRATLLSSAVSGSYSAGA